MRLWRKDTVASRLCHLFQGCYGASVSFKVNEAEYTKSLDAGRICQHCLENQRNGLTDEQWMALLETRRRKAARRQDAAARERRRAERKRLHGDGGPISLSEIKRRLEEWRGNGHSPRPQSCTLAGKFSFPHFQPDSTPPYDRAAEANGV